jgi:hypothetical protein
MAANVTPQRAIYERGNPLPWARSGQRLCGSPASRAYLPSHPFLQATASARSVGNYRKLRDFRRLNPLMFDGTVATLRALKIPEGALMDVTVFGPDNVVTQVDVDRYKLDPAYRREIHEQLEIAEGQPDLDWDSICAAEEELAILEEFLCSLFEPRH